MSLEARRNTSDSKANLSFVAAMHNTRGKGDFREETSLTGTIRMNQRAFAARQAGLGIQGEGQSPGAVVRMRTLTDSKRRRALNLAGLVLGLGGGQGVLFVAQSWLIVNDHAVFLGLFGAAFTVCVLIYQIIDWGGLIILARETLHSKNVEVIRAIYWSFSTIRVIVAVAVVLASALFWTRAPGSFSANYGVWASLGLIIFAFNPSGIVDGRNLSGLTGITASAAYVLTALALPYASTLPIAKAGALLGGAFSVGMTVTTALQVIVLSRLIPTLMHPSKPVWSLAWRTGKEGLMYLLGWTPGQLLYRGQIALCGLFLGAAAVGYFVYAKQIVNAANQILAFTRRVEFPRLIEVTRGHPGTLLRSSFEVQRASLALAFLASLGVAAIGVVAPLLGDVELARATVTVSAFAPTVLSAAVFGALSQTLVAIRRMEVVATTTIIMVVGGLAATAPILIPWGVASIAVVEVVMHGGGAIALAAALRRQRLS